MAAHFWPQNIPLIDWIKYENFYTVTNINSSNIKYYVIQN